MAWTAPRTWVTGETVTAALMNTHIKDNLLETASAKVTTAGDLTYATAANTLARLGIGTVETFLRGGAGAPSWSSVLGDATTSGILTLRGPVPALRVNDEGSTDPADWWQWDGGGDNYRIQNWDDSLSAFSISIVMDPGDFILHTGDKGNEAGAVIVFTDTSSSQSAFGTGGVQYLDVTAVNTGGPAYVKGNWMVEVERTADSAASQFSIQVREDGNNLAAHFSYGSNNTANADIIPAVGDVNTYTGSFYRRVTATDTSDYELFLVAGDDNHFRCNAGFMYIETMQYPT